MLLLFLDSVASCGLRVVPTNSRAELPHRTGEAKVLNSCLEDYQEFNLCSRLKTLQFTTSAGSYPFQVVLHFNKRLTFLTCFVMVPCSVVEANKEEDCTEGMKIIQ